MACLNPSDDTSSRNGPTLPPTNLALEGLSFGRRGSPMRSTRKLTICEQSSTGLPVPVFETQIRRTNTVSAIFAEPFLSGACSYAMQVVHAGGRYCCDILNTALCWPIPLLQSSYFQGKATIPRARFEVAHMHIASHWLYCTLLSVRLLRRATQTSYISD